VHCVAFSFIASSPAWDGAANSTSIAAAGITEQTRIAAIVLKTFFMIDFRSPQQRTPRFIPSAKNFEPRQAVLNRLALKRFQSAYKNSPAERQAWRARICDVFARRSLSARVLLRK